MRVFGTKQVEPTYEDRAAAARLSAVAARFKPQPAYDEDVVPVEAIEESQDQVAE